LGMKQFMQKLMKKRERKIRIRDGSEMHDWTEAGRSTGRRWCFCPASCDDFNAGREKRRANPDLQTTDLQQRLLMHGHQLIHKWEVAFEVVPWN